SCPLLLLPTLASQSSMPMLVSWPLTAITPVYGSKRPILIGERTPCPGVVAGRRSSSEKTKTTLTSPASNESRRMLPSPRDGWDAGTLGRQRGSVNRPMCLIKSVTGEKADASQRVLPSGTPERRPGDQASACGIHGGRPAAIRERGA